MGTKADSSRLNVVVGARRAAGPGVSQPAADLLGLSPCHDHLRGFQGMIHVVMTIVMMYCSITFLVLSINPIKRYAAQHSLFMRLHGRHSWQTHSQCLGTQLFPNSSFPPLFGFLCFRRLATCERLACVNLCFLRNASENLRLGFRRVNWSLATCLLLNIPI